MDVITIRFIKISKEQTHKNMVNNVNNSTSLTYLKLGAKCEVTVRDTETNLRKSVHRA